MSEKISFEEFKRVRLVVGKITSAKRLERTKKLLILKVDIGSEERQLVAGIAEHYKPEELVGKNIVVVANLQPKVIRGRKSEGMLLAAVHNGVPVLLIPEKNVPPGTPVE